MAISRLKWNKYPFNNWVFNELGFPIFIFNSIKTKL